MKNFTTAATFLALLFGSAAIAKPKPKPKPDPKPKAEPDAKPDVERTAKENAKIAEAITEPDQGAVVSKAGIVKVDDATRSDRLYFQLHLGASFLDARRDTFIARWSPTFNVGYRFGQWGIFSHIEFDQTFDFTVATDRLDVLNVGIGGEHVWFLGHLRTSLAVGASTLLSKTEIDEVGQTGVFLDFRPASIRWPLLDDYAIELTPLAFDVLIPEPNGIPLVVYAYMTTIGFEWAAP